MDKGLPRLLLFILIGYCHISISHQMINWDVISKSSEPQSLSNFFDTFYLNSVSEKTGNQTFLLRFFSKENTYIFQEQPEFKRNDQINTDLLASQFFPSYKKRYNRYNRARVMMGKRSPIMRWYMARNTMGKRSPIMRWYMARRFKKDSQFEQLDNLKNICNTSKNDVDSFSVQKILRCLYFYHNIQDM